MEAGSPRKDSSGLAGGHPQPSGRAGGPPLSVELSKASSPVPLPPPMTATHQEQLATLSQQVQALVGVVRQLQEQRSVEDRSPLEQPQPPRSITPVSRRSAHGRSPPVRRRRSHASPGPHLQGSRGEPLSVSPCPHSPPPKSQRRGEPRGGRRLQRRSSSLSFSSDSPPVKDRRGKELQGERRRRRRYSSSSSPGSPGGTLTDRMERRLEEQDRKLEELSQRLTHQPGSEYDARPPFTRRIVEEPVPKRFRFPQLDP